MATTVVSLLAGSASQLAMSAKNEIKRGGEDDGVHGRGPPRWYGAHVSATDDSNLELVGGLAVLRDVEAENFFLLRHAQPDRRRRRSSG